jgi:hypothetical protein
MASPIEEGFCMIEYAKTNSCTNVQRTFRKRFLTDPPPQASIQRWFDNFGNQRCICKETSNGRPRASDEAVGQVEATSIEVQGNLCGRQAVSYKCKFYADGFT